MAYIYLHSHTLSISLVIIFLWSHNNSQDLWCTHSFVHSSIHSSFTFTFTAVVHIHTYIKRFLWQPMAIKTTKMYKNTYKHIHQQKRKKKENSNRLKASIIIKFVSNNSNNKRNKIDTKSNGKLLREGRKIIELLFYVIYYNNRSKEDGKLFTKYGGYLKLG